VLGISRGRQKGSITSFKKAKLPVLDSDNQMQFAEIGFELQLLLRSLFAMVIHRRDAKSNFPGLVVTRDNKLMI